jgi:rubredoxin
MVRESVDASVQCPRCRSPGRVVYVARGTRQGVRFSASFACSFCGHAFEADEKGIPDDVRPLFYKEYGRWRLVVLGLGPNRAEAMRGLRDRLGLSLAEVADLLRRIPAEVAQGTRAEVDALKEALVPTGVLVEAARC